VALRRVNGISQRKTLPVFSLKAVRLSMYPLYSYKYNGWGVASPLEV